MLTRTETIAYCERETERLRSMLPTTTTEAIKARLIERVRELRRIANGETAEPPDFELIISQSRW